MNLALKLTLVPIALMQTLYIAGKSNIKCMAAKDVTLLLKLTQRL